jgi:hypothetical protein
VQLRGTHISAAFRIIVALLLVCAGVSIPASAYSVLTHEAIVDSTWDTAIKPLLLARFPNATPEQLKTAHAYAYGGCLIQDSGYYPYGSKFFSDLLHYTRTADFITALIQDSKDLNEYAFALGALTHYFADNNGHRIGVNRVVPLLYPKQARKYGDRMTYADNPEDHLKSEFAFDVVQVARGHYAPDAYRDYIGFSVADDLLHRAFRETYSLDLDSVFINYDRAIGSYRFAVSKLIPKATKVAWVIKKKEIMGSEPGMTRRNFLYHLSRASYRKRFGKDYGQPGFGTRALAFVIRIIPKVGPLKALSFRTLTPQAEQMFEASFNAAVDQFQHEARSMRETGKIDIANDNLDTGTETGPGEYSLADRANAALVHQLAKTKYGQLSPDVRALLLQYFSDLNNPLITKEDKKGWPMLVRQINELKAVTVARGDSVSSKSAEGSGLLPMVLF